MPRGNYGPEIKASMGTGRSGRVPMSPPRESPADVARDASKGIKEGSAQDTKLDAMPQNQVKPPRVAGAVVPARPVGAAPPADLHHVAAATSIAHAILGGRGGGM